MESSDSQLSDIIRQGKLNESPRSLNRTQEEFNQFSQETRRKIENGEYILPCLSQNSKDEIENSWKSQSMDPIRDMFERKDGESIGGISGLSAHLPDFSDFSASPKYLSQPELKRRTARIHDQKSEILSEQALLFAERFESSVIGENRGDTILDQATRMLNDSFKKESQDSLMNISIESTYTFTQKVLDSQTTVDYLRKRTDEEQKERNIQKKLLKLARVKEESYDHESGPIFQMPVEEPQMPMEQAIDYADRDVFADEDEDNDEDNQINVGMGFNKLVVVEPRLELRISETRTKKMSDYAMKTMPESGSFLWAKSECEIPLEARWYVPPSMATDNLALRVRFVNYDRTTPLEAAMTSPFSDVKKCRLHIEKEATGIPAESFFYLKSPGAEWKSPGNKHKTGHFFRASLPPGTLGMDFDIKFSCQEKCMGLQEKRKKMCLVVFLEDENGCVIARDFFREVRIVAYPRRDYRNFCEKLEENEIKKTTNRKSHSPLASPFQMPSSSGAQPSSYGMFNVSNTDQMLPSTSSCRKRTATDMLYSSSTSMTTPMIPKSDHQRELLLGRYGPKDDSMDVQLFEEDENVAKRSRSCHYPFTKFAVPNELVEAVAEFLADKAMCARTEAIRASSLRRHPFTMQENMKPTDPILVWITTFDRNDTLECFESNGIRFLGDLIEKFESDPEVFEKIGIPTAHLKIFNEIFLNFYYVYYWQRLKEEKQKMYRRRHGL